MKKRLLTLSVYVEYKWIGILLIIKIIKLIEIFYLKQKLKFSLEAQSFKNSAKGHNSIKSIILKYECMYECFLMNECFFKRAL